LPSHAESLHWRAVFAFCIASLLTIALGAVVMAQADIPLGIWIRNPIAWLLAGAGALLLASRGLLGAWLAPVALIIIALSLIGPDQQGVHRWLNLGPIQLNAAALVLPAAIAAFMRTPVVVAISAFAIIAGLLAWQPDISQLAAFALAATLLSTARLGLKGAGVALLLSAGAIALCLSRPDPLAPVPHVEGIFTLAWSQSPGLAIAMAVSLALAALSPLLLRKSAPAALALTTYFAATSLAVLLGANPVPLAGYGLSFVIGWWFGFAFLCVPILRNDNSLTSA
jgi:hypothetical protein